MEHNNDDNNNNADSHYDVCFRFVPKFLRIAADPDRAVLILCRNFGWTRWDWSLQRKFGKRIRGYQKLRQNGLGRCRYLLETFVHTHLRHFYHLVSLNHGRQDALARHYRQKSLRGTLNWTLGLLLILWQMFQRISLFRCHWNCTVKKGACSVEAGEKNAMRQNQFARLAKGFH